MMFTESALNFSGLCLTMKRKTLEFKTGTLAPVVKLLTVAKP